MPSPVEVQGAPSGGTSALRAQWKNLLLLGLLILLHTAANGYWLSRDNQPPLWDMALHQTAGLAFHDFYAAELSGSAPASDWWGITGAYPPLYHHLLALLFAFGRDPHVAVWANLPATLMLVLGTYLLGCRLFSPGVGVTAAAVLLGFPFMAWMSRETIIDYTLAAVVLWGILCLHQCDGFRRRRSSLLFGVCAALSAWTKWIGPVFLILPALGALQRNREGEQFEPRLRNLLDALIVAGSITLCWYLPKLPSVLEFLKNNVVVGAAEGEPSVFSLQSAVYYLRLLEGEQLHGLFFVLFGVGCWHAFRTSRSSSRMLFLWILGGYAGLTLLRTKDPRFTLALLPAAALLCCCGIQSLKSRAARGIGSLLLVAAAAGHFLLVSFGWSAIPDQVLIARGYQGSFSWDWRLYGQRYMNLLGAPVQADWPQREILQGLMAAARPGQSLRVGVVPDLPRFNHENLRLEARLSRMPVEVFRIPSLGSGNEKLLLSMSHVVVSEGDQGMPWSTQFNQRINDFIFARPQLFQIQSFARVPGGPALRIYRVQNP